MMKTQTNQSIHILPGRVRVRLPRLKGNASLAGEVERTLTALAGVLHVETSTTTGSVLVVYEPQIAQALHIQALGLLLGRDGALGLACEDVDMDRLQDWLHMVTNGADPGTPTTSGSDMAAWLNSANPGVAQVTGEWGELRTLVPLTLAFLGL